jgi:hypothetical protein
VSDCAALAGIIVVLRSGIPREMLPGEMGSDATRRANSGPMMPHRVGGRRPDVAAARRRRPPRRGCDPRHQEAAPLRFPAGRARRRSRPRASAAPCQAMTAPQTAIARR